MATVRLLLGGIALCSCVKATESPPVPGGQTALWGQPATAVIGQQHPHGMHAQRLDARGLAYPTSVAAGEDRLYIVDAGNRRVLGYKNLGYLDSHTTADVVINQSDFASTDFSGVPLAQRFAPHGVTLDEERNLYVWDEQRVIMIADPLAPHADPYMDARLEQLPNQQAIRTVRSLATGIIAVVLEQSVVLFAPGSSTPLSGGIIGAPRGCDDDLLDVSAIENALLLACNIHDPKVFALALEDGVTLSRAARPILALVDIDPNNRDTIALETHQDTLLLAHPSGNRVIIFANMRAKLDALLEPDTPPYNSAETATGVLGQGDTKEQFVANWSPSPRLIGRPTAHGLFRPQGLAVGPEGRLWVADTKNSRVVSYDAPWSIAEKVVGQPDLHHATARRTDGNALASPQGLASHKDTVAIADAKNHRVVIYGAVGQLGKRDLPTEIVGQDTMTSATPNRGRQGVYADGLDTPMDAWLEGNTLLVADAGNRRVVKYEKRDTGFEAVAVYGAQSLTKRGWLTGLSAIAVDGDTLFAASGHRVVAFNAPGTQPWRVFGQAHTEAGIDNQPNRGLSHPNASTLYHVRGLAVDAQGTLWVADSGNHRVVYFNAPTADTSHATVADGVVGQSNTTAQAPDFGAADDTRPSRWGLENPGGIAVTRDGTLWVADTGNHRVVAFAHPKQADAISRAPRLSMVLGQEHPDAVDAHLSNRGQTRPTMQTLSSPSEVALGADGNALWVSDTGNHRVLRFDLNAPPLVLSESSYRVARGDAIRVPLQVRDREGHNVLLELESTTPGFSVSGQTLTFQPPPQLQVGDVAHATLMATDRGPGHRQNTATITFEVVSEPAMPRDAEISGIFWGAKARSRDALALAVTLGTLIGVMWLVSFVVRRRRQS